MQFMNPSQLMSSMRNQLPYIPVSLSYNTMLVMLVVIILGSIGMYYLYNYSSRVIDYKPNKEKMTSNGPTNTTAELLFFYADWCPHCKTAKPIWNDLKTEYQNKTVNGYHITFTDVNCSEETQEVDRMMNTYNVEGYPTIKLIKDGQVIEYDAKPSKETLTQFLNTVL